MEKVLFVDDEPNVLEGIQRGLRKRVDLQTATSPAEGLRLLREAGPFSVVVSDMRMPEMNGAQFLARAHECSPNTVRMILSGQADLEATISAVNQGHIFRFMCKPCSSDELWAAVEAGIEQFRLVVAEKVLLEQTLSGAVKTLIEILGMVSPAAYGRASRLHRYVVALSGTIGLAHVWELPLAAMVSQIGCLTLPSETLSKVAAGQELGDEEKRLYESHPEVAGKLLVAIPRLGDVAAIVAGQCRPVELDGRPADVRQWDVRSAGQALLRAACEFDRLVTSGIAPGAAIDSLTVPRLQFPAAIIEALRSLPVPGCRTALHLIRLRDLVPGMIFDQDLASAKGIRLVASGQEVTTALLVRLRTVASGVGVVEPFRVRVPL